MKKIILSIILLCLLLIIFIPISTAAQGLVQCGNGTPVIDETGKCTSNCPCGILDFFATIARIYDFIVRMIATPLAIIALTVGGIFILISAGNPNLMGTGKKIMYAAIIGLVLVWCSWLIIDFVLKTVGYTGNWSVL